jgi:hypothetical protein
VSSNNRVRIEIAFRGGQVVTVQVPSDAADGLERALAGDERTFALEADDGHYVVALGQVTYVKRHQRESRIGFGGVG